MYCVAACCGVRCSVLQCVAVCCSVLQCVAVCCSALRCVVTFSQVSQPLNAVCRSVLRCALQCVVVCCTVLQCLVTFSKVSQPLNVRYQMAIEVTFENFLRLTASKEEKTGSDSWPLSLTRVRAASPLYRCLLQCAAVCCSVFVALVAH